MHHDNRDCSGGCHGGCSRYGIMGDDDIDAEPDEFFSELLGTIASRFGIAELDLDILAFRIAESMQTTPERISERVRRRRRHQHTNTRQFSRLLCPRREWPRHRRTANKLDELTPLHGLPSVRGSHPTTSS